MKLFRAFVEPWIYVWLLIIFSFLSINYSDRVALIYTIMIVIALFLWVLEKFKVYKPKVEIDIPNTTIKSLGVAAITMVAFVGISIVVSTFLQNLLSTLNFRSLSNLASIFNTWASSNPPSLILSNDPFITLITFGLLIPIVETVLLVKIYYALFELFHVGEVSLKNIWVWLLALFLGAAAVMFHITAKGINNNTALLLVGIFFAMSCLMTVPLKEGESPIWLHIFNNTLATIKEVKIF